MNELAFDLQDQILYVLLAAQTLPALRPPPNEITSCTAQFIVELILGKVAYPRIRKRNCLSTTAAFPTITLAPSILFTLSNFELFEYVRIQHAKCSIVWSSTRYVLVEGFFHVVAQRRGKLNVLAVAAEIIVRADVEVSFGVFACFERGCRERGRSEEKQQCSAGY